MLTPPAVVLIVVFALILLPAAAGVVVSGGAGSLISSISSFPLISARRILPQPAVNRAAADQSSADHVSYLRLVAGVERPTLVAAATDGRLFVTDSANGSVKVFLPGGATRLLPSLDEGLAARAAPFGVAIDPEGRVFVSDIARSQIVVYEANGGGPRIFAPALWQQGGHVPAALAVRDGLLYATDLGQHQLLVLSLTEERLERVIGGGAGSAPGEMRYPNGVWVGADGTVYVSDTNNDRIQRFLLDGSVLAAWYGPFSNPRGITGDAAGRLYVANALGHEVLVVDREGHPLYSIDRAGSTDIAFPTGVAVEGDHLYATDRDARGVHEWRLRR